MITAVDTKLYVPTTMKIINKFCETATNRQRDYLYDYLNKELDIIIDRSAYDYEDKRSEYARFKCTNPKELAIVVERVVRELKKK